MAAGNRHRVSRDRRLIATVDVGGAKSACLIAALPAGGGEIDVIGLGQHGGAPGARAEDAESSLRAAIESAERMAGERISSAWFAASGRSLAGRRIGVDLEIAGGVVTKEDIADCLSEGARATCIEGCAPLHAMPVRFLLDGEPVSGAPEGMAAEMMTAEVLGLCVRESYAANAEALLGRVGLAIDEIVAAPLAAAEAVLIDDEKELGVIMIDIGARSTDFAIYERGALVACGGVNVGGEHVTRDIAHIFGAPLAQAERIKTLYGAAFATGGDENRIVDFPQLGSPSEIQRHSRAELAAVIAPRLEEILEMVMSALPSKGANARAVRRCVLTGGGSLLIGARETAERVLNVKTRLGRPAALAGAPAAATAPQFAAAVGVLQYAARARSSVHRQNAALGLGRATDLRGRATGLVGNVGAWLRANF